MDARITHIEALLLREFRRVPFHTLFMLLRIPLTGSRLGGTCSDKALHFRAVLLRHGYPAVLHTARINGRETHRLLRICLDGCNWFADPGSGWPVLRLLPVAEPVAFRAFGIAFKTTLSPEEMVLWQRKCSDAPWHPAIVIPLDGKPEVEILRDIRNRYREPLPFSGKLRYSRIIGNSFWFVKGKTVRRFRQQEDTEEGSS